MDKNKLYEILDLIKEDIGADKLIDNLAMAMDTDDLQENLEYINRQFNLGRF